MWLCYGIQQTDKTALGTMAVFGLRQDTGLHGQQYSWLTTIFCTFSNVSWKWDLNLISYRSRLYDFRVSQQHPLAAL